MDPVQITPEDAQQGAGAVLALLLGRLQAAEVEIAALKRELLAARVSALDTSETLTGEE